jgi:phosphoribosylaminoimidazole carboxylase (NCAIR synthetase)
VEPKEVAERYVKFQNEISKVIAGKEREEVEIDDVRFIAHAVLKHRIAVRPGAGIGASSVVDDLLA